MKILILCLGNICRSPLAEGLLRSKLPSNFEVASAGTSFLHQGQPADPRMIETAKNRGLDISGHRAQGFSEKLFNEYDRIYCMDKSNLENALPLATSKAQKEKLQLLLENQGEVPDPYFGEQEGFEQVYDLLDKALTGLAAELKRTIE